MKILVTPTSFRSDDTSNEMMQLKSFADELVFNPYGRPLTEDEIIELIQGCDGYIAGLDYITQRVVESADKLKVISRYGAGYDRIDMGAATRQGIIVTNTPGVNAEAVGELAIALILSVARKLPMLNQSTKSGQWLRTKGIELSGKKIGILGLGAIGKVVARCAIGLNMEVLAYDPYIDTNYCETHGIIGVEYDYLISNADVISFHLPLNDSTKHMVNKETIEKMKEQVILINTSRGGILDEDAAYEALINGKIGGLGLDVFEIEPPDKSPLLKLENVIALPHTGSHTNEATLNMAKVAVTNLMDVLQGDSCKYIVNKQVIYR